MPVKINTGQIYSWLLTDRNLFHACVCECILYCILFYLFCWFWNKPDIMLLLWTMVFYSSWHSKADGFSVNRLPRGFGLSLYREVSLPHYAVTIRCDYRLLDFFTSQIEIVFKRINLRWSKPAQMRTLSFIRDVSGCDAYLYACFILTQLTSFF